MTAAKSLVEGASDDKTTDGSLAASKPAFSTLPEHLRLVLRRPDAERVMGPGGPEVTTCIHGTHMAVFCAECAAHFCSMMPADIQHLAEPFLDD